MTRRSERDDPAETAGRLFDQFGDALFRYAAIVLADREAAADVVQQVFVSFLQQARPIEDAERYLRRAIRNGCFSALRVRRREPVADEPMLEAIGGFEDPVDRLALEQALRALPPEQREVVHLKVFEGLTFQEIAEATMESANTVASRYRYAMEKLRGHFGAYR
jgi:RNA polymerase sigma-70 factor (ECF subfamily)